MADITATRASSATDISVGEAPKTTEHAAVAGCSDRQSPRKFQSTDPRADFASVSISQGPFEDTFSLSLSMARQSH